MSAPAAKKRRTSGKRRKASASSTAAASVHEAVTPGGWFIPHEAQAAFPSGGVDASAGVVGIPLPVDLLCPGGNHEMAMGNVVGSHENRCLMNLFVWLVECAHLSGLSCYLETIVDADALDSVGWPIVLRCRLFVPVPTTHVETFLETMRSLLRAAVPGGDGLDDAGGGPQAPSGRSSGAKSSGGWNAASRTPPSVENIDSIAAFLAAVAVAVGRPDDSAGRGEQVDFAVPAGLTAVSADSRQDLLFGDEPDNADESAAINAALVASSYAPLDEDAEGGVAEEDGEIDHELCSDSMTFSSRSPMTLLSAKHMFSADLCEWDERMGADRRQLRAVHYFCEQRLMFPSVSRIARGAMPPLVVELTPYLDGRIGNADELMDFMWPLSQAPVTALVAQCKTTLKYMCASTPEPLETAKTVADVQTALREMASSHHRGVMIRPELLQAPNFPHRSEAPASFRHPFERIWPIQSASMQRTSALLSATIRRYVEQEVHSEKVHQIFDRQLKSGFQMMVTPTRGVDPTFCRLAQDMTELQGFVEAGTNIAAESARDFFYQMSMKSPSTVDFPDERPMPLLSAILAQKTALVRAYLNISAAQIEAFIPIEASGHGMGGDEFGQLQQTWLLKGPFDTGKSYVLDKLGTCVPPSMWHQAHHVTAGSRTLPEFRGYHMADEQKTNTSTAGKGRGAAATAADCDLLSSLGGGWIASKRLVFDSRRDKDVSRLEEAALDKRMICVAAGNGMYDQPFESRCTVKLMGRNEKSSGAFPTRQELTLSGVHDSPGREATSGFFRYSMALSNWMWVPFAAGCLRRFDTTMIEIFYALTVKFLVPAGFPDMECRPLSMMKRQAKSYAVMRLSTQWERLSKLTPTERDEGRMMFFLANACVQAQDVLQAYFDITTSTDTEGPENQILSTLKSRIAYEVAYGNVPKVAPSNAGHYVTNVRGPESLAEACPKLGESIIQSVLPKLQFSTTSGAAKVGIERDSAYRNCLTISKQAADDPSCLTPAQEQILLFLIEQIEAPIVSGARQWYPEVKANGEETGSIVFRASVLQQIQGMAGQINGSGGQVGRNRSRHLRTLSTEDRRLALDMFERSELMSFRPEGGGDGERNALVGSPIAQLPGNTTRAKRFGMLDDRTALDQAAGYQRFFDLTPDDEPTQEQLQEWINSLPAERPDEAKKLPNGPPFISVLDLRGVLVVRPGLRQLLRSVQAVKCRKCNTQPPPGVDQHEVKETALQKLINVLFAISGEAEPGHDIYCGASAMAAEGIKWRRVQEFTGTVSLKNPRRREVQNASLIVGAEKLQQNDAEDDTAASILPPHKKIVVFESGDNLTERLLQETRKVNVPFADPDDDHVRRPTGYQLSSRQPLHRATARGTLGSGETILDGSGSVRLRQVDSLQASPTPDNDEQFEF